MSNNNQLSPYRVQQSGAVALRSASSAYRPSTAAQTTSHRALVSTPQRTSIPSSPSQSQAIRVQLTPITVAREKVASVHLDQSLIFGSPRKSTKASASTEKPKSLSPEKSDAQLGYLQKGRLEFYQGIKVNTRAEIAAEGAKRQAARATAPDKRMNAPTSPISTTASATHGNGPGPAAYFPCKPAATKEERRHLDTLDKRMADIVKEKEIKVVRKITEGPRMEVRDIVKEKIPKSKDTHNNCTDTIMRFYEPKIQEQVEKFKDSAPKGKSLIDHIDSQTNQWIKNFSKEVRLNINERRWTLEKATVPKEMSTPNESKDTESTSNTVVQRVHEASPLETTGDEAGLSNKDVGDNATAVGLVRNVVPPKTQIRKDNEPRILTPAQKKTEDKTIKEYVYNPENLLRLKNKDANCSIIACTNMLYGIKELVEFLHKHYPENSLFRVFCGLEKDPRTLRDEIEMVCDNLLNKDDLTDALSAPLVLKDMLNRLPEGAKTSFTFERVSTYSCWCNVAYEEPAKRCFLQIRVKKDLSFEESINTSTYPWPPEICGTCNQEFDRVADKIRFPKDQRYLFVYNWEDTWRKAELGLGPLGRTQFELFGEKWTLRSSLIRKSSWEHYTVYIYKDGSVIELDDDLVERPKQLEDFDCSHVFLFERNEVFESKWHVRTRLEDETPEEQAAFNLWEKVLENRKKKNFENSNSNTALPTKAAANLAIASKNVAKRGVKAQPVQSSRQVQAVRVRIQQGQDMPNRRRSLRLQGLENGEEIQDPLQVQQVQVQEVQETEEEIVVPMEVDEPQMNHKEESRPDTPSNMLARMLPTMNLDGSEESMDEDEDDHIQEIAFYACRRVDRSKLRYLERYIKQEIVDEDACGNDGNREVAEYMEHESQLQEANVNLSGQMCNSSIVGAPAVEARNPIIQQNSNDVRDNRPASAAGDMYSLRGMDSVKPRSRREETSPNPVVPRKVDPATSHPNFTQSVL